MNGFILLHRSLLDHPYWTKEPFTFGQAWVDLLMLAAFCDHQYQGRNQRRGEVHTSQDSLANRWKWPRKRVRRFLLGLEVDQMCTIKTDKNRASGGTIISICNYDTYQKEGPTNDPSKGPSKGPTTAHQRPINGAHHNKGIREELPSGSPNRLPEGSDTGPAVGGGPVSTNGTAPAKSKAAPMANPMAAVDPGRAKREAQAREFLKQLRGFYADDFPRLWDADKAHHVALYEYFVRRDLPREFEALNLENQACPNPTSRGA